MNIKNLDKMRYIQLEILQEFDRICKKNKIVYQLFSGTLLGAVRHKGYIPWDDDIDVCMLRKDYENFLQCCREDLDSKYFLQTYENDRNSPYNFTRIRKNNTYIHVEARVHIDMHQGVFIDVFPMDKIKPKTFMGSIQYFLLFLVKKIKPTKSKHNIKNVGNIIKKIIYIFIKPFSMYQINTFETKIATMFEKQDLPFSSCLSDGKIKSEYNDFKIDNRLFYNIIDLDFEAMPFSCPANYHDVLTNSYGNYMELPPEEKRVSPHGVEYLIIDNEKIWLKD